MPRRRRPLPLDAARVKHLCRRLTPAAAAELRVIADDHGDAVAREMLVAPRSIETVVALLSRQGAADDAVALLHNADIGKSEAFKDALWEAGAIEKLVTLLDGMEEEIMTNAAGALAVVCIVGDDDREQRAAGHQRVRDVFAAGAVDSLISLLEKGPASSVARAAANALYNLLGSGEKDAQYAVLNTLPQHFTAVELAGFDGLLAHYTDIAQDWRETGESFSGWAGVGARVDARLRNAMDVLDEHADGMSSEVYRQLANALGGRV